VGEPMFEPALEGLLQEFVHMRHLSLTVFGR
jgi:hypothetical protein